MKPCSNCGEDVGDAAKCPNCGRRQYRYAIDDATDTASEFRDDDRPGDLDEVAEILRERIQPSAPARRDQPKSGPPREWDYGSAPKSDSTPQIQGQDTRSGPGCLLVSLLIGFGLFWFLLIVGTVTDAEGEVGASILGGIVLSIIPALIILRLVRRWRRS